MSIKLCIHTGTGALHRPVWYKVCCCPYSPPEPRAAGAYGTLNLMFLTH